MLCVGFHKMFPITTIIAITTKNFFFIQSHSFAKFRFINKLIIPYRLINVNPFQNNQIPYGITSSIVKSLFGFARPLYCL